MGTRGCWGFYRQGRSANKLTYNHMDSYPEFLGENVVNFIKDTPVSLLNQIFDKIILVDNETRPSDKEIMECSKYSNTDVSTGSLHDWYCLLREAQGEPNLYKEDLRYMIDNGEFIKDSLFCEWAYVINLDTNELEIYQGFRKKPNTRDNRYRIIKPSNGYYACEMIISFPLSEIPDNWLEMVLEVSKKN